jgi:hypothetical protein
MTVDLKLFVFVQAKDQDNEIYLFNHLLGHYILCFYMNSRRIDPVFILDIVFDCEKFTF